MASSFDRCEDVCRACLSSDQIVKDLFSTQINGIGLDQIFSQCVGTPVHRDDGLPPLMCDRCMDTLQVVHNFQELCHASEQKLRNVWDKPEGGGGVIEIKAETVEEEIFAEDAIAIKTDESGKIIDDPRDEIDTSESEEDPTEQPKLIRRRRRKQPSTFKCNFCDEDFASPRAMVNHMQKDHIKDEDKLIFRCEHCPVTTSRLQVLSNHVKCHAEQKSSQCDICKETFETLSHLSHHINQKHNNEKPYVCKLCRKGNFITAELINLLLMKTCLFRYSFQHSASLSESFGEKTHVNQTQVHENNTKLINFAHCYCSDESPETSNCLCSECGRTFKYPSYLREHMLTHSNTKSFACPQCPKRFNFVSRLNVHMVRTYWKLLELSQI